MTYVVFGATGKLGHLVVDALLARSVAAAHVVSAGRNADALAGLAERGVKTVRASYDDQDAVARAVEGAEAVLLISGNEPRARVEQHRTVIDAAKSGGVKNLVYTSVPKARDTTLFLAPDHKATEEIIEQSGISATILRNNFYTEGYQGDFTKARENGVIVNSVGEGRTATATRKDYAEAAAVALLNREHDGHVYELGGDHAWNYAEFAAAAAEVLGTPAGYEYVTVEVEQERQRAAGLDDATIGRLAIRSQNVRNGDVDRIGTDLSTLIGRPTTPLIDTLRGWV